LGLALVPIGFLVVMPTTLEPTTDGVRSLRATVFANAVIMSLTGTYPASYRVGISMSWVTDCWITIKTATSSRLTFVVPAGGEMVDVLLWG